MQDKETNKLQMPWGRILKSFSVNAVLSVIAAASLCVFLYVISVFFRAEEIGREIGVTAGKAAGRFIGSYDGITQGMKDGKSGEVIADDVEADVVNKIQTIGNLEVLSASVIINDTNEVGNGKSKALLSFCGDIIFTVDLLDTVIQPNGKEYNVILPQPKVTLRLDETKSEKLASDLKHPWSGSAKHGYEELMKSIDSIIDQVEEKVANYEVLQDDAKQSAIKQVSFLIQSATKEEVVIHVDFAEISAEPETKE